MNAAFPLMPAAPLVLGEGVWGRVFDLGDGTVLKLMRGEGGLGETAEKWRQECMALAWLAEAALPFAIPRLMGSGAVPDSDWAEQGYAYWLRSTKLAGKTWTVAAARQLEGGRQRRIAAALGQAMAALHGCFDKAGLAAVLKPDGVFTAIENRHLTRDDAALVAAVQGGAMVEGMRAVHGDFNISNILFDAQDGVAGVVDFAEICLGTCEDEIAGISDELPEWEADLIAAYQAASGYEATAERMKRARAKRSLIGMLLCRYRFGRPEEALAHEEDLRHLLD